MVRSAPLREIETMMIGAIWIRRFPDDRARDAWKAEAGDDTLARMGFVKGGGDDSNWGSIFRENLSGATRGEART